MQINVLQYFESGALARCPDKVAVRDGDRDYTFRDLEQAAKSAAGRIIGRRDVERQAIAVFLPKGFSTIAADLGIIYSGNCYMNLDSKSPLPRIRSILEHVAPELVITSRDLLGTVKELGVAEDRVLLVEDNAVNQVVATELLEAMGHSVVVSGNGKEAAAAAAAGTFDLIFMDVQMPEMSGFEATAEIRRHEARAGGRTPIVAMTAHAVKGDAERCIEAGMDGYLSKPVSGQRIAEAIEQVLARPRPPQAPGHRGEHPPAAAADVRADASGPPAVGPPPGQTPAPTAAADAPAETTPVIDQPTLLGRCLRRPDIAARVLDTFRQTVPALAEAIEQCLRAGQTEQAGRHAHTLKGAAANISAEPLREVAARLERLGKAGAEAAALSALPELELQLHRCLDEIGRLRPVLAAT